MGAGRGIFWGGLLLSTAGPRARGLQGPRGLMWLWILDAQADNICRRQF